MSFAVISRAFFQGAAPKKRCPCRGLRVFDEGCRVAVLWVLGTPYTGAEVMWQDREGFGNINPAPSKPDSKPPSP